VSKQFTIEAWSRALDCIAFRRVQRVKTIVSTADHFVLDKHAHRVIVWREGIDRPVAEFNVTGGWRFDDESLRAAFEGDRD
jgi:hypothetical protein